MQISYPVLLKSFTITQKRQYDKHEVLQTNQKRQNNHKILITLIFDVSITCYRNIVFGGISSIL